MTIRTLYSNVLRELRKTKAPHLQLEDMLYWMNKGVQEYVNMRYNAYEVNQQLSDDLAAIATTITYEFVPVNTGYKGFKYKMKVSDSTTLFDIEQGVRYNSSYIRFAVPRNYLHTLGLNLSTETIRPFKCYPAGYGNTLSSKRLPHDVASGIINNAYLRPAFDRIYHNFSSSPTSDKIADIWVYYGENSKIKLKSLSLDFLRQPTYLFLTPQDLLSPIDSTPNMEFPEYVCQEILKRIVILLLENAKDPRLQTHIPVNTSIPPTTGGAK